MRAKIYMAWFDTTLRLEVKSRTLEIRPTATGIVAEFTNSQGEPVQRKVDLGGNPEQLINDWLKGISSGNGSAG